MKKKNLSIKTKPKWSISILFPNGKNIVKKNCLLEDIFNTYFLNLDKLIDKSLTAEELLQKYEESFKSKDIKIGINYIDSWGHTWSGKIAWPKRDKFIEFLNKKLND